MANELYTTHGGVCVNLFIYVLCVIVYIQHNTTHGHTTRAHGGGGGEFIYVCVQMQCVCICVYLCVCKCRALRYIN